MEQLQLEARLERFTFVDRLVDDWAGELNRFDQAGETLCGGMAEGVIVAVGGLNRDPFAAPLRIGRIRRVYVRHAWRRHGIGAALVGALVEKARQSFDCVRLRTDSSAAAHFYERIGFTTFSDADATHSLDFEMER